MRTREHKLAPRLLEWAQGHQLLTLIIACVLFYLVMTIGLRLGAGIRHAWENRTINQLEQKADKAESEANKQLDQASREQMNRQAEDLAREETIKPEVERTARDAAAAKERTRRAQSSYEKARKQNSDLGNDSDLHTLHERNCADLRELYPGESIPLCQN